MSVAARQRPVPLEAPARPASWDPEPVTIVAATVGERDLADLLSAAGARAGCPMRIVAPGQAKQGGIVLDLTGRASRIGEQETWRLEAAGRTLTERLALSGIWHRPPYHAAITLVRHRAGAPPETIGVAQIGTRGGYRALRAKAEATASILVQRALSGPAEPDLSVEAVPVETQRDGVMALAAGWARAWAARWHARLHVEWWTVGICDHPIEAVLRQGRLGPIRWLRPEPGAGADAAYWADPFAWPGTGRLLCEEYADGSHRPGVIAVLCPGEADGTWRRERILMGDRLHRSYPFTWREGGQVYLLPECLDGAGVTLYRLDPGGQVEMACVITQLALADASLFAHEDRYWVAGTDVAIGMHDNLCLFYADRPEGPWLPHRGNPVKVDIRSSRPAGTPFHHEGALFRPAQDCAATYGAAVVVNRVVSLTPERFLERSVLRLTPDRAGMLPDGLHTLSAGDRRTFVDGKRLVWAPGRAVRRAWRRMWGATWRRRVRARR